LIFFKTTSTDLHKANKGIKSRVKDKYGVKKKERKKVEKES